MIHATSLKSAGLKPQMFNTFSSIYQTDSATLGPGVYSYTNRNEYQKQKKNISGE
jgi:hypothetical protein